MQSFKLCILITISQASILTSLCFRCWVLMSVPSTQFSSPTTQVQYLNSCLCCLLAFLSWNAEAHPKLRDKEACASISSHLCILLYTCAYYFFLSSLLLSSLPFWLSSLECEKVFNLCVTKTFCQKHLYTSYSALWSIGEYIFLILFHTAVSAVLPTTLAAFLWLCG